MPEFKKKNSGFLQKRREEIEEYEVNLDVKDGIVQEKVEKKAGPGRPRKKPIIKRTNPKTIKFDDATNRRIQMLKIDYKLDQQDVIFLAVQEYLDKYFPKGKASPEDIQDIRRKVAELNGV